MGPVMTVLEIGIVPGSSWLLRSASVSLCYLFTHAPVDNLHFLFNILARGVVGFVLGWIQESPGTQERLTRLGEDMQRLQKENRSLRDLLTNVLLDHQPEAGPVILLPPPENDPPLARKPGRWRRFWPITALTTSPIEEGERDAGQSPSFGTRKSIESAWAHKEPRHYP